MARWEGSKKDETEDKRLAKKAGVSLKSWEKSAADKRHDEKGRTQRMAKGRKK